MIKFLKDLFAGEPVMFTGLVSTGLTSWSAALVAQGQLPPVWLAVGTPVWVAVAAFYARQKVSPL